MALPSHSLLVILTHQAAVWHEQVVGDGEAIHHTLQQHLHPTQKPKSQHPTVQWRGQEEKVSL